jgi:hypothetical protein
MNNQYITVRSFRDKETGKTYGIGSTFEANDQKRAMELEMGGYIAAANSQAAQAAQSQAKGEQAAQANAENVAQAHQQARQAAEAKTVVNGKVVPLSAAQAAEAAFETMNTQTGIQAHHDNSSEAVAAGQVAQQSQQAASQQQMNQQTGAAVRQANVQSGQQHLEGLATQTGQEAGISEVYNKMNTAMQQQMSNQMNQQNQQQTQQAAQAAAARAEQTNPAAAEAEEAAMQQKAAAKARAKKENQ